MIKEIKLLSPKACEEEIIEVARFFEPIYLEVKVAPHIYYGIENKFEASKKYIVDSLEKFNQGQIMIYAIGNDNSVIGFKKFSIAIDEEMAREYINIYKEKIPNISEILGNPYSNFSRVEPNLRRKGIARALEDRMIEVLIDKKTPRIIHARAEISNEASIARFSGLGYHEIGGLYPDPDRTRFGYDEGSVWFRKEFWLFLINLTIVHRFAHTIKKDIFKY